MTVTRIAAAKLVEDMAVYPRHRVDDSHVRNLARALEAGVALPPVVADKRSLVIADGIHRVRAHVAAFGDECSVPADLRSYRTRAALLQDAVALNSGHGRRLTSQDYTRAALLLKEAGFDDTEIAVTMQTTVDHVSRVLLRIVVVDGEPEPAKPSAWAPKGLPPRQITRSQADVHRSANGWRHGQTIRQLTNELRAGLVDVERHAELLEELRDAITSALASVSVPA